MNFNFESINADPLGFIKNNKKKNIIELLIIADNAFFNGDKSILKDEC